MKKIFLILTILALTFISKAQLPNQLPQGSAGLAWYQRGTTGADLGIHWRLSFGDTTAANSYQSGILKNIAGLVIRVVDDYYARSNDLQKWNKINGGGGGSGTVTSVAAGNGMNFTTITGAGTVTLGTPSSVTLASTNSLTSNSHTHAFVPGGTTGQYIRGDGTLATLPTTIPISSLTAAAAGNSISNANFTQQWAWNTRTGFLPALLLTSTSTALTNGLAILSVTSSGANSNASQTATAANFSSSNTGTTSTNNAAIFTASGATNNYAINILGGGLGLNGSAGTSGQVLTSAGANAIPTWETPTVTTSLPISSLTAAGAANDIENENYDQVWRWSSLGNNTGLSLISNATTAANNNQKLFTIIMSGANATSTQTTYGQTISNTHTGTSSTNIGLQITASGGSINNAINIAAGNVLLSGTSKIIGGTSTTADLTLQTTSGVGASGADMHFLVGNNGATEAMTILNSGAIGVNQISPAYQLDISSALNALANFNFTGAGNMQVNFNNNVGGNVNFTFQNTGTTEWYVGNDGPTNRFRALNASGLEKFTVLQDGSTGIGVSTPTARFHIAAGAATAGFAPLKFTSGTNLTVAEAGAMEWNGTNLFITQTTGPTRKTLAYTSDFIALTGTSTATGNILVESNTLEFSVHTSSGGIKAQTGITTVGDFNGDDAGTKIILDNSNQAITLKGTNSGNGTLFFRSAAISGASAGDALTIVDPATGEIGVAPNLTFQLHKQGTDIWADNGRVWVSDSSGNKSIISPHYFPSDIKPSEDMAWSFYSRNEKIGKEVFIDMLLLARKVEELTGEKLVHIKDIKK